MRAFFDRITPAITAALAVWDQGMTHYMGLRPRVLGRAFDRARLPEAVQHDQPALRFQQAQRLSHVAGDYAMPAGLDARDVEAYVLSVFWAARNDHIGAGEMAGRLQKITAKLLQLNPQLNDLRFDRAAARSCFDVCMGVTSVFNLDDIQHFIDGKVGYVSLKDPAYRAQHNRILAACGHMHWVPSPATMTRIETQLQDRKAASAPVRKL